jgi:hypothetical protein
MMIDNFIIFSDLKRFKRTQESPSTFILFQPISDIEYRHRPRSNFVQLLRIGGQSHRGAVGAELSLAAFAEQREAAEGGGPPGDRRRPPSAAGGTEAHSIARKFDFLLLVVRSPPDALRLGRVRLAPILRLLLVRPLSPERLLALRRTASRGFGGTRKSPPAPSPRASARSAPFRSGAPPGPLRRSRRGR